MVRNLVTEHPLRQRTKDLLEDSSMDTEVGRRQRKEGI